MTKKIIILTTFCTLLTSVLFSQKVSLAFPNDPEFATNTEGNWIVYDVHIHSDKKIIPTKSIVKIDGKELYSGKSFQLFSKDSTAYIEYVWIKIKNKSSKNLQHQVIFKSADSVSSVSKTSVLNFKNKHRINWPIEKGLWLAANAPGALSEHTCTTIKTGPKKFDDKQQAWLLGHNNQRFAIDFVKLNQEGLLFQNDGLSNEDWFCFGTPIKAVAKGKVINVIDSIPDNKTPGKIDYKITKYNIGGNSVYIDMGDGYIAYYAHFKHKSITVKVGDTVDVGTILGMIGNSGQSTAPHLHFHLVTSGKTPFSESINGLAYEGVAYSFKKFNSHGLPPSDFWTETPEGKQIIKPFTILGYKKVKHAIPINAEIIAIE